jgi:hypothetical protein
MLAKLRNSKFWEFIANKMLIASVTSSLIISQHALKKAPVKPSRPGALSDGMLLIVSLISSWVNGFSSSERSCGLYPRECQLMVVDLGAVEPMCSLN